MEYKKLPFFTKEIDPATHTVTGIFAVHGNLDEGWDISEPGSFAKRLGTGRDRVRFLWNHDGWQPPIASIKDIREVTREELPGKVLLWAPDATGGVLVTRKYYADIPLSDWVWKAVSEGDVGEMSYAYEVHAHKMIEADDGKLIRILKDVELFDISDVNWGLNPATAGVKGLPVPGSVPFIQHAEMVGTTVAAFVARAKDRSSFRAAEGRTLSETASKQLAGLVTDLTDLLKATAPQAPQESIRQLHAQFLRFEAQQKGV